MVTVVVALRVVVKVLCRVCRRLLSLDEQIYGICDNCVDGLGEDKGIL